MKKTVTALSVAVLAAFGTQAVMAQSASSPSRAEVKKETAEANKAGQIPGTGMSNVPADATGSQSPRAKAATSTTTRSDRKAATAEANKSGQIPGSGTGPSADAAGQESPREKAATSTTTRADRKAATAEANKSGQIPGTTTGGTPAEATTAPKK